MKWTNFYYTKYPRKNSKKKKIKINNTFKYIGIVITRTCIYSCSIITHTLNESYTKTEQFQHKEQKENAERCHAQAYSINRMQLIKSCNYFLL